MEMLIFFPIPFWFSEKGKVKKLIFLMKVLTFVTAFFTFM